MPLTKKKKNLVFLDVVIYISLLLRILMSIDFQHSNIITNRGTNSCLSYKVVHVLLGHFTGYE